MSNLHVVQPVDMSKPHPPRVICQAGSLRAVLVYSKYGKQSTVRFEREDGADSMGQTRWVEAKTADLEREGFIVYLALRVYEENPT